MVDLSVQVRSSQTGASLADGGSSFSLASADSFSASISGCLSGFSKTGIAASTSALQVQKTDKNCVSKLDSLGFAGENFSFGAGAAWSDGSSFESIGSSGTKMRFSIVKNLDATIAGPQTVQIVFAAVQSGAAQTLSAGVGTAISVSGADPVYLDVLSNDVEVAPDGAGNFRFVLQCSSAVSNGSCLGLDMNKLRSGVALDSFSGVLTLEQCRALALDVNNGNKVGTLLAAGDPVAANGGLSKPQLKGPAKLYDAANANLIFALANTDASGGCKYFKVSVSQP